MKWLRRILLVTAMLVMAASVAILHDVIRIEIPVDVRPVAIGAGVVALALLMYEGYRILRSWQLPRPEDPPRTEKIVLPKEPEKPAPVIQQAEQFAQTAVQRVKIRLDVEDSDED